MLQLWQVPFPVTFSAGPNTDVGIFTADADCEILAATERHETLGTDVGAVTADIKKASSGTSINGGTSLLASTFNLKATINTTQEKTRSNAGLAADRVILKGQCVGVDFGGVMTAVTGVCITLILRRLREPSY